MAASEFTSNPSSLANRVRQVWADAWTDHEWRLFRMTSKETPEEIRERLWASLDSHLSTWMERHRNRVRGNSEATPVNGDAVDSQAIDRLAAAGRHLIILRQLQTPNVPNEDVETLRSLLWNDLQPQVSRIAAGFQRTAAKRGFEVEDLMHEAAIHLQNVVPKFDTNHPRKAAFATWFDDVVSNLFASLVRPRKSDVFHRGQGNIESGPTEPGTDADISRQSQAARVSAIVREIEDFLTESVKNGELRFEQVLAFRLYLFENLTYQEVANALEKAGYSYGTTQIFNFVKEIRKQIVEHFDGDPFQ
ncbi:RNA polymerase sigma factor [Thalassoroseus pseudoceratinae]|uniref:RNA polymerase sigma factor n=1 Tax=Thalassoroseus pseudoceratinae TaxID=2713176 RepID=UPI00141E7DB6|nr:sigma-70 family RNA polymerase sigma factor [Thalassoroseus pseudoceratinae]